MSALGIIKCRRAKAQNVQSIPIKHRISISLTSTQLQLSSPFSFQRKINLSSTGDRQSQDIPEEGGKWSRSQEITINLNSQQLPQAVTQHFFTDFYQDIHLIGSTHPSITRLRLAHDHIALLDHMKLVNFKGLITLHIDGPINAFTLKQLMQKLNPLQLQTLFIENYSDTEFPSETIKTLRNLQTFSLTSSTLEGPALCDELLSSCLNLTTLSLNLTHSPAPISIEGLGIETLRKLSSLSFQIGQLRQNISDRFFESCPPIGKLELILTPAEDKTDLILDLQNRLPRIRETYRHLKEIHVAVYNNGAKVFI